LTVFFEKVLGEPGSEAEVQDFMGRMTELGNLAEVIGRACESSIDQTSESGIERSSAGHFVLEQIEPMAGPGGIARARPALDLEQCSHQRSRDLTVLAIQPRGLAGGYCGVTIMLSGK
jgi:hypothetical protein